MQRARANASLPGRTVARRIRGVHRHRPMITLARALACFMVLGATLVAQSPAPNDAIFRYRGADRDARLVERAKREGRVVVYTSLAPTESQPLAAAFEKKYGVKVELWRALSDQVVRRTITEAQARRHTVDVIETNGPEMEMLAREKLLGAVIRLILQTCRRRQFRHTDPGFRIASTSTSSPTTPRRCSARRSLPCTRASQIRNGRDASRSKPLTRSGWRHS